MVDIEAWVPPGRVANDRFAGIGLTSTWVTRRSGITSRAWFDEGDDPVDAAADVMRRLLGRCDNQNEVGALLVVSTSIDTRLSSTAQAVATRAGLGPRVLAIDLNAACSGFVYSLIMALGLVSSGAVREAVVCSVEAMSRLTDLDDRQTAFLFGDGIGAVRVADREEFGPSRSVAGCDAAFADLMVLGPDGIRLRGIEVYEHAVARMGEALTSVSLDAPPGVVVAHQANGRILEEVRRGLPDPAPVFVNRIAHLGNTSSASIPLALAAELTEATVPRRGRLAAVAYGAGETWGAVALDYAVDHELPVGPHLPDGGAS